MYSDMFDGIAAGFIFLGYVIWYLIGAVVALLVRPDFEWSVWCLVVIGWYFVPRVAWWLFARWAERQDA